MTHFCSGLELAVSDLLLAYLVSTEERTIGINYGRVGDNLPASAEAVKLIQGLGVGRVRIFDFDAGTISAFANTGLELIIGMGNDAIAPLATSASAADEWISTNVVPYYPATNITYIMVGNELFVDSSSASIWLQLVPAIQNLHTSLQSRGLSAIKLSTAAELGILSSSYPPSNGVFRSDIAVPVLTPLLKYLESTSSYLFVNVYPYFGWATNAQSIPLDYALFARSTPFVTDGSYSYYSLLDAQVDALVAAMAAIGFTDVRLAISETGWPTLGDSNQPGANITNGQTYNNNLVKVILSSPTRGTPRRPGVFIPTFIFALFNEDLKTGATTERNWGVLYPNGTPVYPLDIKSSSSSSPAGSGSGTPGSPTGTTDALGTCNGKPSVLPLSVSFFGILFNLRI